jgi:hypothetical protein
MHQRVPPEGTPGAPGTPRPFLGIRWECCGTYSRIYKNKEGTAYTGFCPRCAKPVRVLIGEGGTGERFFVAR